MPSPGTIDEIIAKMKKRVIGEDGIRYMLSADEVLSFLNSIEVAIKRERALLDANVNRVRELEAMLDGAADTVLGCAIKQKQSTQGNAALLRAALKDVLDHAPFATDHATMLTGGNDLLARLRHAYYAPARNCDRFADVLRASEAYEATRTDLPFEEWLFSTEKGKETDNG